MSQSGSPLELVRRLVDGLDDAGVQFCHWKSNEAILASESGENDLDLLVHPDHLMAFQDVATSLSLKIARPPRWRRIPGLIDHLGLDEPSGALVQVQCHDRLIVGDDATKNYVLPIVDEYLTDLKRPSILPIPRPVIEYLLLVVRLGIKHCPFDAIVQRQGRVTASEVRELEHLRTQITSESVHTLATELLPPIRPQLLDEVVLALDRTSSAGQRMRAGRRLLRALRPYTRRPEAIDLPLRVWRRFRRRLDPGGSRKQFDSGGRVIAVIGGDGSGKSSTVTMIESWLGDQIAIETKHLGKPPWSLTRKAVGRLRRTGIGGRSIETLMDLVLARDRARQANRCSKAAARGRIVITDRFPLAELTEMDWVRLEGSGWAARLERNIYQGLTRPETILVLKVTPEVAAARRPEQDRDFVLRRATAVSDVDWETSRAVVIDADASIEEVHRHARRAVWDAL